MDHGPYLDHRAWTMVHGPCTIAETMVYEPLNMGHGSWFMDNGPFFIINSLIRINSLIHSLMNPMDDGPWSMDHGSWSMHHGPLIMRHALIN